MWFFLVSRWWLFSMQRFSPLSFYCFTILQSCGPQHFCHQGPVLQKTIFPQMGLGGGFRVTQMHCIYCALYSFHYYTSLTSDHQAFNPGGWRCLLQGSGFQSEVILPLEDIQQCLEIYFLNVYLFLVVLGLHCSIGLSLVAVSGDDSLAVVRGLLTAAASLVAKQWLQGTGLQQSQHVDSRAQAQQMWCTGLVALQHVGSSQTRDRTLVSCIGRWILYH